MTETEYIRAFRPDIQPMMDDEGEIEFDFGLVKWYGFELANRYLSDALSGFRFELMDVETLREIQLEAYRKFSGKFSYNYLYDIVELMGDVSTGAVFVIEIRRIFYGLKIDLSEVRQKVVDSINERYGSNFKVGNMIWANYPHYM